MARLSSGLASASTASVALMCCTICSSLNKGVETAGALDHLRGEHVNEAQGFLLSRPLDAASLETQLLEPLRDTTQAPA